MFHQLGTAVLNIFVMTLGEIEFGDNFVAESLGAFETDVYVLLFIFLFLMPIVLMNLMVCSISSFYFYKTKSMAGDKVHGNIVN